MTQPISFERVTFLRDRLTVVEACIKIAQSNMYAMQSGGVVRNELQASLMNFNTERFQIMIELRVLEELGVTE